MPPTSPSAGAFTYASANPAVATISGDTVTITGAGSTVITATQAADGNYTGGSVQMPLGETFWAEAFGMVTDRFGTPWGINGGPKAMS